MSFVFIPIFINRIFLFLYEFLSRKRFISVHMIIQAMKVHLVDALASRGDEGRDTLR